jgi:hypothetical protein
MGEAAAANNVGVLYCCAPPSVHMKGVTVPAAFGVRASPDYVWAPADGKVLKLPTVQWAIGPDSAFHWNGLGLLPYARFVPWVFSACLFRGFISLQPGA